MLYVRIHYIYPMLQCPQSQRRTGNERISEYLLALLPNEQYR